MRRSAQAQTHHGARATAPHQVDAFVSEVQPLAKRVKGAAEYQPARLL